MLGLKHSHSGSARDEAEKPFWISYADLMTALMVLFLVAMTVALLAVTNDISEADRVKKEREDEIAELLQRIGVALKDYPGVSVHGRSVVFDKVVFFDTNSHKLPQSMEQTLRSVVPKILGIARDPLGEKWVKRVIVEGFADRRGTYLYNLNLSIQRSQRVLCVLLASSPTAGVEISNEDKLKIRELFLVGGSSFNALKESLEESRRVELKLEFLDLNETRPAVPNLPLDTNSRCPLD